MDNKSDATSVQRFAVPWLITFYGLSYAKYIQIYLLKEITIAIIDENHLVGEEFSCLVQSKIS